MGPTAGSRTSPRARGPGVASLERLAWAGALDGIPAGGGEERREALWSVGVTANGRGGGRRPSWRCRWSRPQPPPLEPLGDWGELIADYRSTGIAFGKHPLELMRPGLDPALLRSSELERAEDGSTVEVAGMVVARQRPGTAKGIVFMTLEDERGIVNVIVPKRVYERHRATVRAAVMVRARGRLERREGVVNVLVDSVEPLEREARPQPSPSRGPARPSVAGRPAIPPQHPPRPRARRRRAARSCPRRPQLRPARALTVPLPGTPGFAFAAAREPAARSCRRSGRLRPGGGPRRPARGRRRGRL